MAYFSALGLGGTLLPGILWARAQEADLTVEMVAGAADLAGLSFTDHESEMMLRGLENNRRAYRAMREQTIPNEVVPALHFDPQVAGTAPEVEDRPFRRARTGPVLKPGTVEEVAFWPVTMLSELVRTREVSSAELTNLYLDRLERFGGDLEAVITLTRERAIRQAHVADREIAHGRYRGPLHGIPWGAKDLLAVDGYPTTWGAMPFASQELNSTATVVRRLDEAGAVLVAKLSLGALAMGDYWFGGRTRNPWNLEQGSSGSSAGSAAATVAGLVGFSIGSETLGSIVSPSTRTGATGLRPTFGRVSRAGAMALSWSMDKLGPLCRSVEDCALVLDAIHGSDGRDPTARDVPFPWDGEAGLHGLRIGYVPEAFEGDGPTVAFDRAALVTLRDLGADLVPMSLPDEEYPLGALRVILSAEAAAAFDDLTRTGQDDELVRQTAGSWPNSFRTARFIPAVEYIQANRIRTMVMGAMHAAMDSVDVLATPSFAEGVLLMTNLTGHPAVVLPNGFDEEQTPVSFSFVGGLWKDDAAMRVAKAYQDATGHHLRHPARFGG
jgi:Asp-tRNA(Asn)/Glu-tRNA(Gln) amidotransferase A subunit family amidase